MKIAVLRANGLGDFIFVLPALEALRAHFTKAEIVYLGCPWHKKFIDSRRSPIDRVIVIPPSDGVRIDGVPEKSVLDSFFNEMRQEKFNLAFQLHGGGKYSNPFVKRLETKKTIGLQDKDASPLDISIPYVFYQSEYLRYLEVVAAVGVQPVGLMPRIEVTEKDIEELEGVEGLDIKNESYVVIHPGAKDLRRRWPIHKFMMLSSWFTENGYRVVVTGTESEKKLTNQFNDSVINLCGKLSLSALTALISHATLLVSNDTGPYHLAVALNTPAVGIFWCGNMINGAPLFRTRHHQIISWQTHCPLCGMNVATPGYPFTQFNNGCKHEVSFVEEVKVDDVIKEILFISPTL